MILQRSQIRESQRSCHPAVSSVVVAGSGVFVSEPWVAPGRISVLIGNDLVLIAGVPESRAALNE